MSDDSSALREIRAKIRGAFVKIQTVIKRCEDLDKNKDGVIHRNDLEDVLRELLKEQMLSRRELNYLCNCVAVGNSTSINYNDFYELMVEDPEDLKRKNSQIKDIENERWLEDKNISNPKEKWATRSGTVGDFIFNKSCPAEVKCFKKFIRHLELYEKETGMKVELQKNGEGFIASIGPDLRATITFHIGSM